MIYIPYILRFCIYTHIQRVLHRKLKHLLFSRIRLICKVVVYMEVKGLKLITRISLLLLLVLAPQKVKAGESQVLEGDSLKMYVDELPKIPKIYGYISPGNGNRSGAAKSAYLTIGMYKKLWKFHRDLPPSPVFVYGGSAAAATFPGPAIEALHGVPTYVRWENHLPARHILPWDPTVPTAIPKHGGVPAVVHLHGGIQEPQSDGSAFAWYTADFREKGPAWSKPTYTYTNAQHAGNLWYHDHALGLTRASLLAGLLAPYVIRDPALEAPFMLPSGPEFDRHLIIADRGFNKDGSIYMNFTGNNPDIHPQWQPEYFGDTITVNGKAWPYLKVHRRKYRFRIINASNARYLRLALSDGTKFTVVGSDFSYLRKPVVASTITLSPAEIYDVVLDFSNLRDDSEIEITNDAPYPYPDGTPASLSVSKVMKFIVLPADPVLQDNSRIPAKLADLPLPSEKEAIRKRYIVMYEYVSNRTGNPTHLYINGKRLEDPVTETPKSGSTEVWEVINLTPDNHPLHIHLAAFQAVRSRNLLDLATFQACMERLNDAVRCNIRRHAAGEVVPIPEHERTWKNVVKMDPGAMTTIVVKFNLVDGNRPYPFDATAVPGYVYHCHILDHEDNAMIRPLKLVK